MSSYLRKVQIHIHKLIIFLNQDFVEANKYEAPIINTVKIIANNKKTKSIKYSFFTKENLKTT
jgi:hypothetical protein